MTKKKFFSMEYIWLFLTILTFILFVINTFKTGFSENYILLILSAAAFLMYVWRRAIRKKEEG